MALFTDENGDHKTFKQGASDLANKAVHNRVFLLGARAAMWLMGIALVPAFISAIHFRDDWRDMGTQLKAGNEAILVLQGEFNNLVKTNHQDTVDAINSLKDELKTQLTIKSEARDKQFTFFQKQIDDLTQALRDLWAYVRPPMMPNMPRQPMKNKQP